MTTYLAETHWVPPDATFDTFKLEILKRNIETCWVPPGATRDTFKPEILLESVRWALGAHLYFACFPAYNKWHARIDVSKWGACVL